MNSLSFEKFKDKIDHYFSYTSKEDILLALRDAGIDFYPEITIIEVSLQDHENSSHIFHEDDLNTQEIQIYKGIQEFRLSLNGQNYMLAA